MMIHHKTINQPQTLVRVEFTRRETLLLILEKKLVCTLEQHLTF
jgi:hypothetical protein